MRINNFIIGRNSSPYVIAELSGNHNGSLQRALSLIDAAAEAGADAVKLQTYSADTMTIDCERPDFVIDEGLWSGYKLYDLYKEAATPLDWHKPLFERAAHRNLTIFSTPFDESGVEFLERLGAPAYKIASFEICDLPLIACAASTGKPLILSTGMASEDEVAEALETAISAGANGVALLHCVSSYPTDIKQINIRRLRSLYERFKVPVGLSDHTMGSLAAVTSVALGAVIIEKHFTLSRLDKGPDSAFSMEPDEFKRMCTEVKDAWSALGTGDLKHQGSDEKNLIFRRSLYFVKDLPKGHILKESDIRRIRPGYGIAPKYFDEIIGMKLSESVSFGTPVTWGKITHG
ncbi:pseudaminic acid synthase [Betaproteobacteria bacterium LSUCC0117]|nr:pseudaminic acid synthase [Betaproteobacteria bacterium LSUCC0117]